MVTVINSMQIPEDLQRLLDARHHAPFKLLGPHKLAPGQLCVRSHIPGAKTVRIKAVDAPMQRMGNTDIFEWSGYEALADRHYRLVWEDQSGHHHDICDPYSFNPQISDYDLHLFAEGKHWHIYRILGAHSREIDGIQGVLFATWAPNAERVSVVGDFNAWDGRRHPMQVHGSSGVWELFIPELDTGTLYKFEIRNRQTGDLLLKSDPYGNHFEIRPETSSIVAEDSAFQWRDNAWFTRREQADWQHEPLSIYEVHLGSWQRSEENGFLNYRELAHRLVDYVSSYGFTHIELLPITEHPLDASWGYQTTGYFAPTSRHGSPDDFRYFVDYCHRHGIGVILDWVPAHFPKDSHALAHFDGSALYEHEDPKKREHRDWGTHIYNYSRSEVKNFLLASAIYWLEEFHIDGLRVDAVASMLYLDYSREEGDWIPNIYGGNENLEAIDFLRELNELTHGQHPGSLTLAEESTAWPQVTRPTWVGGLGFSMKWNMGWMHDSLIYMSKDPVHRHYQHDQLTFGLLYAFTENFVLPFSHDEVVHGKASMLHKMPGDEWQQFANLRLLYTYMFTYPGKKLLFMGTEFGQGDEWNHNQALAWYVLDYPLHKGVQKLVSELNTLYKSEHALYQYEFEQQGFEWIDCHDASQSVLSYLRRSDDELLVVVLNFTPVPRKKYRLGVPSQGYYREIFNSDSTHYAGSNLGNGGGIATENTPWMGHAQSICITLPPLAGLVFKLQE